jgi:hypothetical protein
LTPHRTVGDQLVTEGLARVQAAADIPGDPVGHRGVRPVPGEDRRVQAKLARVSAQVAVFERPLPVEQQLVHVPEPALPRSSLGRGSRGERVRVDAGQRKMPEREPHVPAQLSFDLLDRAEGLARVWALVIAVLARPLTVVPPDTVTVPEPWGQAGKSPGSGDDRSPARL